MTWPCVLCHMLVLARWCFFVLATFLSSNGDFSLLLPSSVTSSLFFSSRPLWSQSSTAEKRSMRHALNFFSSFSFPLSFFLSFSFYFFSYIKWLTSLSNCLDIHQFDFENQLLIDWCRFWLTFDFLPLEFSIGVACLREGKSEANRVHPPMVTNSLGIKWLTVAFDTKRKNFIRHLFLMLSTSLCRSTLTCTKYFCVSLI